MVGDFGATCSPATGVWDWASVSDCWATCSIVIIVIASIVESDAGVVVISWQYSVKASALVALVTMAVYQLVMPPTTGRIRRTDSFHHHYPPCSLFLGADGTT